MSSPDQLPILIHPLADTGFLVELGDAIDPATTARVMALTAAMDRAALPGVIDLVPSYTTLMVALDPDLADPATLAAEIRRLASATSQAAPSPSREITLPVVYGGDAGPDLADVAAHTGLDEQAVIERHAGASYTVACMGFAPGFGFLIGLPPELATPRLAAPRTRVPAGSVGIGGAQTGVYPLVTPGGWRLIGRTPRRLFDPAATDPFLLRPGDRVRFVPE